MPVRLLPIASHKRLLSRRIRQLAAIACGITIGATLLAKEHTDPLSGIRYEIPDQVKVQTRNEQLKGKPVHVTVALYPYEVAPILALYTTWMWGRLQRT